MIEFMEVRETDCCKEKEKEENGVVATERESQGV